MIWDPTSSFARFFPQLFPNVLCSLFLIPWSSTDLNFLLDIISPYFLCHLFPSVWLNFLVLSCVTSFKMSSFKPKFVSDFSPKCFYSIQHCPYHSILHLITSHLMVCMPHQVRSIVKMMSSVLYITVTNVPTIGTQ